MSFFFRKTSPCGWSSGLPTTVGEKLHVTRRIQFAQEKLRRQCVYDRMVSFDLGFGSHVEHPRMDLSSNPWPGDALDEGFGVSCGADPLGQLVCHVVGKHFLEEGFAVQLLQPCDRLGDRGLDSGGGLDDVGCAIDLLKLRLVLLDFSQQLFDGFPVDPLGHAVAEAVFREK